MILRKISYVIIVLILISCFLDFINYNIINDTIKILLLIALLISILHNNKSEGFTNKVGPYSDLDLSKFIRNTNVPLKEPKFYSNECNLKGDESYAYTQNKCGTPLTQDIDSNHRPTVDGSPGMNKKKLFMLTYNQCKPECCPSTYTCSNGCVCLTDNQRDFLTKRGHNKSVNLYPDD